MMSTLAPETFQIEDSYTPELSELLTRIRKIRPLLAEEAIEGEKNRRVSEQSIEALAAAGAFKVSLPVRYGGYDLGHRAAMVVGREVAIADGGTAWVVSLINSGIWYTRVFPEQAQDDIFGENPDARVSVVIAPSGKAQKVDGGYRVSGKWSWNSDAWHADWALVGVISNGLTISQVSSFWQGIVTGLVLLIAVILDWFRTRRERKL